MIREVLEERPATAEQDRYLVEDELVDESRRERILDAGGDQVSGVLPGPAPAGG